MDWLNNQREEWIQRSAWRLVRSAEDRMGGSGRGNEKLLWAVARLSEEFPRLKNAEDHIRAAFVNLKAEQRAAAAF